MAERTIARISWDLPHGEESVHWMVEDEEIMFGRAASCQIQMGRAPYDERVPTVWGKLSWDGRMRVANLAERVAKWGFGLHPVFAPNGPRDESPVAVGPGAEASLASSQFEIRAKAPGGLGISYSVRVNAYQRPRRVFVAGEPPSVVEIELSVAEKRVGAALIKPLEDGNPVPATYDQAAAGSHYSRDGVRDALARIDAKLAATGLYPPNVTGQTPERVAKILFEQRTLLA